MRAAILHLTSKGQTTIPSWMRKAMAVEPNMDIVAIELNPGEFSLVPRPAVKNPVDALRGMLKGKGADHIDIVKSLRKDREEDIRLSERGFN